MQLLFVRLGRALDGSCWQADLARTVNVNPRTVRRWASGQETPPPGVWRELAEIAAGRGADLALLVEEVRSITA